MKINLPPAVTRAVGRSVLQAQKHSPEILVAAGIAGFVTAGVLAVKATLKVEPVIDQHTENVEIITSIQATSDASQALQKKELSKQYRHTAFELTKLYGPSVTLAIASAACIIGAHGIMRKRNVALAVAYKGAERMLEEYRKRVESEIGIDKEQELYHGLVEKEIVGEDGKTQKVMTREGNTFSLYARLFDESNPNWRSDSDYNLTFLRSIQDHANHKLRTRGHVFLNEVYDWLGMERSSLGAMAGWLYEEGGDDYIDFGLYDNVANSAAFVAGLEKNVWIDFNVDGPIHTRI
jgi:hypothetical protein